VVAPLISESDTDAASALLTRNTAPFNLAGLPAISVPCGFSKAGLPIGMTLVGAAWQEALVLRAGHAYQRATDWHLRRPPLP
jgi:aspartyl-tRNA(Asn)/glutamyl-tRNA(Gln) amidotransferase subunit A